MANITDRNMLAFWIALAIIIMLILTLPANNVSDWFWLQQIPGR